MNGKPNVEPAWMSLKRLVETRMIEILRKEQDNKRYIRLYGTEDYWHAFEESAFQLERLFRKGETTLFSHKDYPFPVVMVSNALFCLLFFVFIPCLIYYLSYLPYARAQGAPLFSRETLRIVLDNQAFMFHYHANIVSEHPYSSRWYQWILDIRPILYYLEYFDDGSRSSICAFLNPALCWGGFLSLFVLGYTALFRRDKIAGFLLVGYLAQLVPWMFIRRLTFEYHYFPSSVFLVLALAYVFRLFQLNRKDWLRWAVPFAAVSLALFALFYPALSGLPVNNAQASAFLGWLPTWPL